jgi:hypothetical protein
MRSSQTLDRLQVVADDEHLVANAGLLVPATLAQHLGVGELVRAHLDLGDAPGHPNRDHKALTLIHALLAGADSIDDAQVLRAGGSEAVLGHELRAPSTLGTFLRSFSAGHARQLDVVARLLLARAWSQGAGPGGAGLTIDLDSTICETYGLQKQGGSRFTYAKVRGYHPLLATAAPTGEVLHVRLRGGPSHTGRGAGTFLAECFSRVRGAGATGTRTDRADSGFYNRKVVRARRRAGARYSITTKTSPKLRRIIEGIPEEEWTPIPYWCDEGAQVAETTYQPFGGKGAVRLIVRRVRPTPGSQLALFTTFSYHAFITDRSGDTLSLEADHRRHAEVENAIRDLKEGSGLNHLPSGRYGANAAWLAFASIAHNLSRWVGRIGLGEATFITTATLRRRYFSVPARLSRSARIDTMHLPARWPWAAQFLQALAALRTVQLAT